MLGTAMSEPVLPERARVVIVGGGIIGCSVAYHLAHLGWDDVVLLERDRLTSGTTWHAAGLMVTFGSTSETSTEMRKYTRDLYARLEAETGLATGLKQVGFIELAADAGRLEEYRRVPATGFLVRNKTVTGVHTPYGDIEAEYVVNCAGMWARQLGALAGVNVALQAAEHYYLVTEPIDGVDGTLPVLEDPASYGYFR